MSVPARLRRATAYAALAAGLPLLAACSGDSGQEPDQAEPTAEPTPITALDPATLRPVRGDFCEDVPTEAAEAAVGSVRRTAHYANGEPARLAPGVRDVAHEFGCTFVGPGGAVARAWVFAPRVTEARARLLARDLRRQDGCRPEPADTFGAPAAGAVCRGDDGIEVTWRGLFTDAWFSCSLTRREPTDQAALVDDASAWCAAAVTAASGG